MLWGMIFQDLKIFALKHLIDREKFTHKNAKLIVAHFNSTFDQCHNCKSSHLIGENTLCPTCRAFNYNLNCEPSFSGEFCSHLEFSLDFNNLGDERLKGFWCDGVDQIPTSPSSLSKRSLLNSKKIETRAWLGKSGQEFYKMTIEFGELALDNYLKNKSIIDCIPNNNYKNWISIDTINKHPVIKLY